MVLNTKKSFYLIFFATGVFFVPFLFQIGFQSWNNLTKTFISETTGLITKRFVLLPILVIISILFLLFIHITLQFIKNKQKTIQVFCLLTLLIAATLRILWIKFVPTNPESDFKIYHETAIALSNCQFPEIVKPLGYPLFLSLPYKIVSEAWMGRLLNVLLSVITVWFVYLISERIFNEETGLFSMFWMAISPTEIFMTSVLGTETILSTFLTGAFFFLLDDFKNRTIKKRDIIFSGLLLGYSICIRPTTGIFLLPILLIFWFSFRKNIISTDTAILVGSTVLVPLLIVIWSSINLHTFTTKSLFYDSYPLLSGTNFDANGQYNIPDVKLYYSWPVNERGEEVFATAFLRIKEMPINKLFIFINTKLLYYFSNNLYGSLWPFYTLNLSIEQKQINLLKTWIDVISQSWYFFSIICLSLLALRNWIKPKMIDFTFLGMFFLSSVPYILFEVQPRYHHLLFPLLSITTGYVLTLFFTNKFFFSHNYLVRSKKE